MDYKRLQATNGHSCQMEKKQVLITSSKSPLNITLILTSITLILSLFIIPNLVFLYKECYKLESEIQAQKELLEFLTKKQDGKDDLDLTQDTYASVEGLDVKSRFKRSDADANKNANRRRSRGDRRPAVVENKSSKSTTEVINLQIDEAHEKITDRENIMTGAAGEVLPYWKFSDNQFNYDQKFAELIQPEGSIKIKQDGMYFIYSQVTYYDRTGRWSHMIEVNNKPFIKCLTSEWGIEVNPATGQHYNTIHQCYTAAVIHISKNQKVVMKGMYSNRRLHSAKDLSFWGIIKMT